MQGPQCFLAGGHRGECTVALALVTLHRLCHPLGRLFSLWVMLPMNAEVFYSLNLSRRCLFLWFGGLSWKGFPSLVTPGIAVVDLPVWLGRSGLRHTHSHRGGAFLALFQP